MGVLYDSNVFKIFYLILIVIAITPRLWRIKRKANAMSPQEKDSVVYKTTNWFGKKMVGVTGSTVEVKGLENVPKDKPVLVVSNHQSNMDIPVLLGYLNKPIGFVSKAEIKVSGCTNMDGTNELCVHGPQRSPSIS